MDKVAITLSAGMFVIGTLELLVIVTSARGWRSATNGELDQPWSFSQRAGMIVENREARTFGPAGSRREGRAKTTNFGQRVKGPVLP